MQNRPIPCIGWNSTIIMFIDLPTIIVYHAYSYGTLHTFSPTYYTPSPPPPLPVQGRDEAGTSSMTPDKINAVAIITRLLDNIGRRQLHLEDIWRERKTHLEQTLQLRVFEKAMVKVGDTVLS